MSVSIQSRVESLIEALPYIQQFRGKLFVIKYGGSAMEDDAVVDRLLRDIGIDRAKARHEAEKGFWI